MYNNQDKHNLKMNADIIASTFRFLKRGIRRVSLTPSHLLLIQIHSTTSSHSPHPPPLNQSQFLCDIFSAISSLLSLLIPNFCGVEYNLIVIPNTKLISLSRPFYILNIFPIDRMDGPPIGNSEVDIVLTFCILVSSYDHYHLFLCFYISKSLLTDVAVCLRT